MMLLRVFVLGRSSDGYVTSVKTIVAVLEPFPHCQWSGARFRHIVVSEQGWDMDKGQGGPGMQPSPADCKLIWRTSLLLWTESFTDSPKFLGCAIRTVASVLGFACLDEPYSGISFSPGWPWRGCFTSYFSIPSRSRFLAVLPVRQKSGAFLGNPSEMPFHMERQIEVVRDTRFNDCVIRGTIWKFNVSFALSQA